MVSLAKAAVRYGYMIQIVARLSPEPRSLLLRGRATDNRRGAIVPFSSAVEKSARLEGYEPPPTANTFVGELPQTPRKSMPAVTSWAAHVVPS